MKDYIKKHYLSVSDSDIAQVFGVSVGAVTIARQRLGLHKSKDVAKVLRDKKREDIKKTADFTNFWNG